MYGTIFSKQYFRAWSWMALSRIPRPTFRQFQSAPMKHGHVERLGTSQPHYDASASISPFSLSSIHFPFVTDSAACSEKPGEGEVWTFRCSSKSSAEYFKWISQTLKQHRQNSGEWRRFVKSPFTASAVRGSTQMESSALPSRLGDQSSCAQCRACHVDCQMGTQDQSILSIRATYGG